MLAGVFFEMRANDADLLGLETTFRIADFQVAVVAERQVVLADLIALGQVGIVILFAVPLGEFGDLAIQRDCRLQPQLERATIHHRQRARHADAQRASLRVGRGAEFRAASAKQLAARQQLHVDFQADDRGVGCGHGRVAPCRLMPRSVK